MIIDGLKADHAKIQAILNWPISRCFTDVCNFQCLGIVYQMFVRNFSITIAPINDILKNYKFILGISAKKSMEEIKVLMKSSLILKLLDFNKTFKVTCDTFGVGIGGDLSQENHLIAFYSEKSNNAK